MLPTDDNAIRAGEPPVLRNPLHQAIPSESSRIRRWSIRALIVVAGYSLLTGGFCYFDRTNFGNEIRLDVENPPLSRIDVQPREREIHVPLLFHYYGFDRPYRLTMYIFDKHKGFDQIELEEVRLDLENGETLVGMRNWRRDIKEADWYGGVGSGGVFMTDQVLDVALPSAIPFSITWKGRLRKKGGEVIPFNEKAVYQVRTRSILAPYWLVLYSYTQL
jgi:hypothetical protein